MCDERKKRCAPPSAEQKEMLIELIKSHDELVSGNFANTSKKQAQELWKELSVTLNSIPGGANKDWVQWRKTWHDIKKHTKGKQSLINGYKGKTAGVGPSVKSLNNFENEVAALIHPVEVKERRQVNEVAPLIHPHEVKERQVNESICSFTFASVSTLPSSEDDQEALCSYLDAVPQSSCRSPPPLLLRSSRSTSSGSRPLIAIPTSPPVSSNAAPSTAAINAGAGSRLKRKRTMRLQKSSGLTQELVEVSKAKVAADSSYHRDKLRLIEKDLAARREFEAQMLLVAKSNLEVNSKILELLAKKM